MDSEKEANARGAASAAAWHEEYVRWRATGDVGDIRREAQAIASAYLPAAQLALLEKIMNSSTKPVGQRHDDRFEFALAQPSELIAELVKQHKIAIAKVEAWLDEGEGTPPPAGAHGPIPYPSTDDDEPAHRMR